jgi:hypothetical protein
VSTSLYGVTRRKTTALSGRSVHVRFYVPKGPQFTTSDVPVLEDQIVTFWNIRHVFRPFNGSLHFSEYSGETETIRISIKAHTRVATQTSRFIYTEKSDCGEVLLLHTHQYRRNIAVVNSNDVPEAHSLQQYSTSNPKNWTPVTYKILFSFTFISYLCQ